MKMILAYAKVVQIKKKNKKEFYTIKIAGEDTGVVHRGVKCKGCEQIIWEEI